MKKKFTNRYDAGRQLAKQLIHYKNTDAIVLAPPRGGVLVGHKIATALNLPLDIVITRKIGHPLNRKVAICAVAEDGQLICSDFGLCGIDELWIEYESALALEEVVRSRKLFGAETPLSIKNKTVIITDDGVVTGLTMKAVLLAIRPQRPKKIVLAIPVCPPDVLKELKSQVDEVVVINESERYKNTVGAYYKHFPEVFDKEVISCMKTVSGE